MDGLTELLGYWNHSLPEKVDYADLVCAPAFARGHRMVYEDEYGYMVEGTIKTLEELQEYKVFAINIGIRENASSCVILTKNNRDAVIGFETIDFGKTVFLTREEAESKLAEMEGANETN